MDVSTPPYHLNKDQSATGVDQFEHRVNLPAHDPAQLLKAAPVTVSWQNVTFSVRDPHNKKQTKTILNSISGRVEPFTTLAILGPSGCGKTTLLDVLADRVIREGVTGDILYEGKPRNHLFRRVASYIPQEDALTTSFSVRETLRLAAMLTIPAGIPKEESNERVEAVIACMGLTDCADTRVGDMFFKGLSGGQKRRLSIGVELVKNPSVLFLDEPTSGLDSAAAFEVMKYLTQMASKGHTVITSIHQPSSELWDLIDHAMLLSKGNVVYYGDASAMVQYFTAAGYECPHYTNPSDYVLGVINTDFPNHGDVGALIQKYSNSKALEGLKQQIEEDKNTLKGVESYSSVYIRSYWDQFIALSYKTFMDNLRNPGVFWVRLFMYFALSFMCGTMYFDKKSSKITDLERTSLLFYVAAFLVFMSVAVLPFFIMERSVYIRERFNGMYGSVPYVLARFVQALPGIFLIAVISTALVVPMAGLNGFGIFLLDLFLSLVIAESFMQVMAALVPHYIIGMALGAGVYGMFMLCEGYLITKPNIPGYWVWGYYIAFHTYSFRIFMYNEFHDDEQGQALLKAYEMDEVVLWQDFLILGAYIVGFQAIFALLASRSFRR